RVDAPRARRSVIERLLVAQGALADGRLDQAEQLFRQVAEADERNAIAVVGLAEVALARGEANRARELAARALAIDPEDAAARRPADAGAAAAAEVALTPAAVTASPVADAASEAPARPRRSALQRLAMALQRLIGRSR